MGRLISEQEANVQQYAAKAERVYELRTQYWVREMLFWILVGSMTSGTTALIYWWGGHAVIEGKPL